ncbi:hypothetical protein MPSEU_001081400 [Mayamaea pseudoterrestris]|nr:hypothetical protein MPSEU_001081400 [Mayamaea pseudoterrestris]
MPFGWFDRNAAAASKVFDSDLAVGGFGQAEDLQKSRVDPRLAGAANGQGHTKHTMSLDQHLAATNHNLNNAAAAAAAATNTFKDPLVEDDDEQISIDTFDLMPPDDLSGSFRSDDDSFIRKPLFEEGLYQVNDDDDSEHDDDSLGGTNLAKKFLMNGSFRVSPKTSGDEDDNSSDSDDDEDDAQRLEAIMKRSNGNAEVSSSSKAIVPDDNYEDNTRNNIQSLSAVGKANFSESAMHETEAAAATSTFSRASSLMARVRRTVPSTSEAAEAAIETTQQSTATTSATQQSTSLVDEKSTLNDESNRSTASTAASTTATASYTSAIGKRASLLVAATVKATTNTTPIDPLATTSNDSLDEEHDNDESSHNDGNVSRTACHESSASVDLPGIYQSQTNTSGSTDDGDDDFMKEFSRDLRPSGSEDSHSPGNNSSSSGSDDGAAMARIGALMQRETMPLTATASSPESHAASETLNNISSGSVSDNDGSSEQQSPLFSTSLASSHEDSLGERHVSDMDSPLRSSRDESSPESQTSSSAAASSTRKYGLPRSFPLGSPLQAMRRASQRGREIIQHAVENLVEETEHDQTERVDDDGVVVEKVAEVASCTLATQNTTTNMLFNKSNSSRDENDRSGSVIREEEPSDASENDIWLDDQGGTSSRLAELLSPATTAQHGEEDESGSHDEEKSRRSEDELGSQSTNYSMNGNFANSQLDEDGSCSKSDVSRSSNDSDSQSINQEADTVLKSPFEQAPSSSQTNGLTFNSQDSTSNCCSDNLHLPKHAHDDEVNESIIAKSQSLPDDELSRSDPDDASDSSGDSVSTSNYCDTNDESSNRSEAHSSDKVDSDREGRSYRSHEVNESINVAGSQRLTERSDPHDASSSYHDSVSCNTNESSDRSEAHSGDESNSDREDRRNRSQSYSSESLSRHSDKGSSRMSDSERSGLDDNFTACSTDDVRHVSCQSDPQSSSQEADNEAESIFEPIIQRKHMDKAESDFDMDHIATHTFQSEDFPPGTDKLGSDSGNESDFGDESGPCGNLVSAPFSQHLEDATFASVKLSKSSDVVVARQPPALAHATGEADWSDRGCMSSKSEKEASDTSCHGSRNSQEFEEIILPINYEATVLQKNGLLKNTRDGKSDEARQRAALALQKAGISISPDEVDFDGSSAHLDCDSSADMQAGEGYNGSQTLLTLQDTDDRPTTEPVEANQIHLPVIDAQKQAALALQRAGISMEPFEVQFENSQSSTDYKSSKSDNEEDRISNGQSNSHIQFEDPAFGDNQTSDLTKPNDYEFTDDARQRAASALQRAGISIQADEVDFEGSRSNFDDEASDSNSEENEGSQTARKGMADVTFGSPLQEESDEIQPLQNVSDSDARHRAALALQRAGISIEPDEVDFDGSHTDMNYHSSDSDSQDADNVSELKNGEDTECVFQRTSKRIIENDRPNFSWREDSAACDKNEEDCTVVEQNSGREEREFNVRAADPDSASLSNSNRTQSPLNARDDGTTLQQSSYASMEDGLLQLDGRRIDNISQSDAFCSASGESAVVPGSKMYFIDGRVDASGGSFNDSRLCDYEARPVDAPVSINLDSATAAAWAEGFEGSVTLTNVQQSTAASKTQAHYSRIGVQTSVNDSDDDEMVFSPKRLGASYRNLGDSASAMEKHYRKQGDTSTLPPLVATDTGNQNVASILDQQTDMRIMSLANETPVLLPEMTLISNDLPANSALPAKVPSDGIVTDVAEYDVQGKEEADGECNFGNRDDHENERGGVTASSDDAFSMLFKDKASESFNDSTSKFLFPNVMDDDSSSECDDAIGSDTDDSEGDSDEEELMRIMKLAEKLGPQERVGSPETLDGGAEPTSAGDGAGRQHDARIDNKTESVVDVCTKTNDSDNTSQLVPPANDTNYPVMHALGEHAFVGASFEQKFPAEAAKSSDSDAVSGATKNDMGAADVLVLSSRDDESEISLGSGSDVCSSDWSGSYETDTDASSSSDSGGSDEELDDDDERIPGKLVVKEAPLLRLENVTSMTRNYVGSDATKKPQNAGGWGLFGWGKKGSSATTSLPANVSSVDIIAPDSTHSKSTGVPVKGKDEKVKKKKKRRRRKKQISEPSVADNNSLASLNVPTTKSPTNTNNDDDAGSSSLLAVSQHTQRTDAQDTAHTSQSKTLTTSPVPVSVTKSLATLSPMPSVRSSLGTPLKKKKSKKDKGKKRGSDLTSHLAKTTRKVNQYGDEVSVGTNHLHEAPLSADKTKLIVLKNAAIYDEDEEDSKKPWQDALGTPKKQRRATVAFRQRSARAKSIAIHSINKYNPNSMGMGTIDEIKAAKDALEGMSAEFGSDGSNGSDENKLKSSRKNKLIMDHGSLHTINDAELGQIDEGDDEEKSDGDHNRADSDSSRPSDSENELKEDELNDLAHLTELEAELTEQPVDFDDMWDTVSCDLSVFQDYEIRKRFNERKKIRKQMQRERAKEERQAKATPRLRLFEKAKRDMVPSTIIRPTRKPQSTKDSRLTDEFLSAIHRVFDEEDGAIESLSEDEKSLSKKPYQTIQRSGSEKSLYLVQKNELGELLSDDEDDNESKSDDDTYIGSVVSGVSRQSRESITRKGVRRGRRPRQPKKSRSKSIRNRRNHSTAPTIDPAIIFEAELRRQKQSKVVTISGLKQEMNDRRGTTIKLLKKEFADRNRMTSMSMPTNNNDGKRGFRNDRGDADGFDAIASHGFGSDDIFGSAKKDDANISQDIPKTPQVAKQQVVRKTSNLDNHFSRWDTSTMSITSLDDLATVQNSPTAPTGLLGAAFAGTTAIAGNAIAGTTALAGNAYAGTTTLASNAISGTTALAGTALSAIPDLDNLKMPHMSPMHMPSVPSMPSFSLPNIPGLSGASGGSGNNSSNNSVTADDLPSMSPRKSPRMPVTRVKKKSDRNDDFGEPFPLTTVPEKESDDENEIGLLSNGGDGWFDDDNNGGNMAKAHPTSPNRPGLTRRLSQATKSFKISAPAMKFKMPKMPKRGGGNGFHGDSLM